MSKVILKFTKGHGRYVKGDVAGFDKDTAVKLRGVTVPYTGEAKTAVDEIDAFAAREADLARREAEFEARLAAAGGEPVEAGAGDPPAQTGKADAGAPPAQGSKAK